MRQSAILALSAVLAATLASTPPVAAQQGQWAYGSTTAAGYVERVLQDFTRDTQRLCGGVPDRAYEVDCLADYFQWLADTLPQTQEFRAARDIVGSAARQLNQIARANAARGKAAAVLRQNRSGTGAQTSRAVIPVAPDRIAAARAAAVAVVRETQTRLLRAAEQSERRKVAFVDIAQAVGSTTRILLRAA